MSKVMVCVVLCGTALARAQQGDPGGTVTGTVVCGDTQKPARFANVVLVKIPDPDAAGKKPEANAGRGTRSMQTAQTGLDGTYTMEGVGSGDYYVSAMATGYLSPIASALATAPGDATLDTLMASLPKIHVEAGHIVRGDIRLERGGAIGGAVTFDDGTPVGATIHVEHAGDSKLESGLLERTNGIVMMMAGGTAGRFGMTDDRGRYRLSGLAPGEYVVAFTLQTGASFAMRNNVTASMSVSSQVIIYAPGEFHKAKGQVVKIGPGEDRSDVNIVVDLNGMRTVSGHVGSAVDHHAVNAGSVTLTDTSDGSLSRTASVDANGNFAVRWVPPGTYTLRVENASDREIVAGKNGMQQMHTLRQYEPGSQTVTVDAVDVTGADVELKEVSSR